MFADKDDKKFTLAEKNEIGFRKELYQNLLAEGEQVLLEFNAQRNVVVLTDRKIIGDRVEAYTARHKAALVIPYSKITAYSAEVSDNSEMDTEFKIWAPSVDCCTFRVLEDTIDMKEILHILVTYIG